MQCIAIIITDDYIQKGFIPTDPKKPELLLIVLIFR
jgi:hypothetical protein